MTARRALAALAVALLVAGAGCQGIAPADEAPAPPENPDLPDPETDVLGWEDGVWHNESIAVDQADGLNDTELRAYVARSMARVEHIRGREFQSRVPVEVISRAEYRNRSSSGGDSGTYGEWNNQVWEAMWAVGEDADVQELLSSTLGESVVGFYSPGDDEIKIVTPTPERPTIDNATLVHELVHALQDQHYDLTGSAYSAPRQDGDLAVSSLVEGDARYVEYRYGERCGVDWACVPSPSGGGGGGGAPPNLAVSLTLYFPYADGPPWVADLYDAGGWAAVDDAWADPPASTEQVVHGVADPPANVTVTDTTSDGWRRYDVGDGGADTLGEASIAVGLWYQSREYGASAVDWRDLVSADGPYDRYDYDYAPSAGWAGDAVVPYHNDTAAGYVWKSRWDTDADATEFLKAYRAVLGAHDAEEVAAGTWVVADGPFADAFRLERTDRTVVVTNAPTVAALDDVRTPDGNPATPDGDGDGPVPSSGFGPFAALGALALLGAGALLASRLFGPS